MEKSESIVNITKAILRVMAEVKGIDKTMQVGEGKMAYKGVPDQEVKKIIGNAMEKNGLAIVPIEINEAKEVSRWEEPDTYNKGALKQKQSVFTDVKTKYLLLHDSGEYITLAGYGQGVDSQDKGAGKATTYALKYTLLYTFLVPTGKIDDADTTHSDNIETPKKVVNQAPKQSNVEFNKHMKNAEKENERLDELYYQFQLEADTWETPEQANAAIKERFLPLKGLMGYDSKIAEIKEKFAKNG